MAVATTTKREMARRKIKVSFIVGLVRVFCCVVAVVTSPFKGETKLLVGFSCAN